VQSNTVLFGEDMIIYEEYLLKSAKLVIELIKEFRKS
jgi:hypothetical protein